MFRYTSTLDRFQTHLALLILRVSFGAMMIVHGWPKFMKIIDGNFQFADPIGLGAPLSLILAGFAEFFCSILIIIGLKTKWASIPLILTMLVAAVIQHAGDPFGQKEKSLLFLVGFVVIFLVGPGKYSLDRNLLD